MKHMRMKQQPELQAALPSCLGINYHVRNWIDFLRASKVYLYPPSSFHMKHLGLFILQYKTYILIWLLQVIRRIGSWSFCDARFVISF